MHIKTQATTNKSSINYVAKKDISTKNELFIQSSKKDYRQNKPNTTMTFYGTFIKFSFVCLIFATIKSLFLTQVNASETSSHPSKSNLLHTLDKNVLNNKQPIKKFLYQRKDYTIHEITVGNFTSPYCYNEDDINKNNFNKIEDCLNIKIEVDKKIETLKQSLPTKYHQGEFLQVNIIGKYNLKNLISEINKDYNEKLYEKYSKLIDQFLFLKENIEIKNDSTDIIKIIDEFINFVNYEEVKTVILCISVMISQFLMGYISDFRKKNEKHTKIKIIKKRSLLPAFKTLTEINNLLLKVQQEKSEKNNTDLMKNLTEKFIKIYIKLNEKYVCPISLNFPNNPFVMPKSREIYDLEYLEKYYKDSKQSTVNLDNTTYLRNPSTNSALKEVTYGPKKSHFMLQESNYERTLILKKIELLLSITNDIVPDINSKYQKKAKQLLEKLTIFMNDKSENNLTIKIM